MRATTAPDRKFELQRAFVSEIFHDLSQPLTALHCSLDLALNRDRTIEELRGSIQTALQSAELLRQRLLLVRALSDADDPGDLSQPTDLAELLRELHEDVLPLFEASGQRLELETGCDPMLVRANKARLTRALFCFLEYLFRHSLAEAVHSMRVSLLDGEEAEIRITASSCLPIGPSLDGADAAPCACEIEMARRSFRAVGGEFRLLSYLPDHSVWLATLPLIG